MGGDAEILLELRKVGLPVPKMGEKLVEFTDEDAEPDTLELLLEELELAEGVIVPADVAEPAGILLLVVPLAKGPALELDEAPVPVETVETTCALNDAVKGAVGNAKLLLELLDGSGALVPVALTAAVEDELLMLVVVPLRDEAPDKDAELLVDELAEPVARRAVVLVPLPKGEPAELDEFRRTPETLEAVATEADAELVAELPELLAVRVAPVGPAVALLVEFEFGVVEREVVLLDGVADTLER
ncbi:hypothetical protein LTR28_010899 [Elasticomyces elasticus]|nr:hypothetical protein LTR28_010899 [Elasticomyces elasticus]